jgi:hypothetical protein
VSQMPWWTSQVTCIILNRTIQQNIPNLNTEVCASSFNGTLKRWQVEWL